MGIPKAAAALIFELKTSENLEGKICTLGRQYCHITPNQLLSISKKFGFKPSINLNNIENNITDEHLFNSLGFLQVESIDIDDYENATHIIDLNQEIPDELCGLFDAIYDGGTLEHVFNTQQCLKNIYKLLKPEGLIMHLLPTNNFVDHGFYMFSPTFFYDYYTTNRWNIKRSNICELTWRSHLDEWLIYDYSPGAIDHLSFGGWGGKKALNTWFVAKKTTASTCDLIPMQGSYLNTWKDSKNNKTFLKASTQDTYLKKIIKSNKILYFVFSYIFSKFRSINLLIKRFNLKKPKIIAKY